MKRYRCLASARAAISLAKMFEYKLLKEERELEMANKKTAKKKRLQEQKKQEKALLYVQNKLGGNNNGNR